MAFGTTTVTEVQHQIQKFWSPIVTKQLKEGSVLASLVDRTYEGEIVRGGDTVRVSQLARPDGLIKTIGVDADYNQFSPEKASLTYVDIKAEKIISASFEFDSLVDLQSIVHSDNPTVRDALVEALQIKLNTYLYSKVSPSASNPDHKLEGVTDFNASAFLNVRKLASQAHWSADAGRWLLVDPSYMNDILNATTLTSADYVPDAPVVAGKVAMKRFGFNVLEDDSAGMKQISPTSATEDLALAFTPDFLHLVTQKQVSFEVAPLTANHKFGVVLVAYIVVGAALGNQGSIKHITVYNT